MGASKHADYRRRQSDGPMIPVRGSQLIFVVLPALKFALNGFADELRAVICPN